MIVFKHDEMTNSGVCETGVRWNGVWVGITSVAQAELG